MRRIVSPADLDPPCPLCHAPSGAPCVSTGGHGPITGAIHRERRRAPICPKHFQSGFYGHYTGEIGCDECVREFREASRGV